MKSFLVLPFTQRVYVTADEYEFTAKYNRWAPPGEKMDVAEAVGCLGMAIHLDGRKPLFMVFLPYEYHENTLFHEALHMAHFIMEYSGAPISMESTETQAYLMESIADQLRKKLKRVVV